MLRSSAIGRILAAFGLFLCAAGPSPASAHSHVFLGFGFSYYAPYPYYYPPYYYYYPPPVYYAPPVVYYSAPAYYAQPSPQNCRTFQGDATNDQTHQPFYGTACLWADGKWHIAN